MSSLASEPFVVELGAPRRTFLDWLPLDLVTLAEVGDRITDALVADRPPLRIATANVDFVAIGDELPSFAALLRSFELVVADGMPIVWLAKLTGSPVPERITGWDLAHACAAASALTGSTVALVGSTSEIASLAAVALERAHPGASCVVIDTPFVEGERPGALVARRVAASGASIMLVALGAPSQEEWLDAHLALSGARVAVGVGGTFDMLSDTVARAPALVRHAGLEWSWRLLHDPRRLVARYLGRDRRALGRLLRSAADQRAGAGRMRAVDAS